LNVVNIPNSRSMFYVNMVRLGLGVSDRVFSTWFAWLQEPDGSFLLAFAPHDEYAGTESEGAALQRIRERREVLKTRREEDGMFWGMPVLARDAAERIDKITDEGAAGVLQVSRGSGRGASDRQNIYLRSCDAHFGLIPPPSFPPSPPC